jgi:hypothetical protein
MCLLPQRGGPWIAACGLELGVLGSQNGLVGVVMLTPDERAALVVYCHDHEVAVCPRCSAALQVAEISTDVILADRDFCVRCRADLTAVLRKHLTECTWMRVQVREVRERTQEIRQHAREASKASQQLRDRSEVLAREAEAAQVKSRHVKRGQPPSGTGA